MSKKVDLNKLSPQELLAYAQNLVKQTEKVKFMSTTIQQYNNIYPSTKI